MRAHTHTRTDTDDAVTGSCCLEHPADPLSRTSLAGHPGYNMSSNRSAPGLLDPATLARELKAATGLSKVTSSDYDAAAMRIAL